MDRLPELRKTDHRRRQLLLALRSGPVSAPKRLDPVTLARHREILERLAPRQDEGVGSHNAASVAAVMSEISFDLETPLWWLDRAYGYAEPYLRAVSDPGAYSPEQIRALRFRYVNETLALILDFEGNLREIAAGCGPEGQKFAERLIVAGSGGEEGVEHTARPEDSLALGGTLRRGEQQAARAARRVDR